MNCFAFVPTFIQNTLVTLTVSYYRLLFNSKGGESQLVDGRLAFKPTLARLCGLASESACKILIRTAISEKYGKGYVHLNFASAMKAIIEFN